MSSRDRHYKTIALVGAIILIAFLLRFWKLGWGIPAQLVFPDERQLWPRYLLAFVPLRPESFLAPEHPWAFLYPSGFGNLVGLLAAAGHALGLVQHPSGNIVGALMIPRLVTATASLATVALVILVGRAMFDRKTALIGGLLMAIVPLCVFRAHYGNVDSLLVMWSTVALIFAWLLATNGSTTAALAAGLFTGLAFGTKYTGLSVSVVVAWAVFEFAWRHRSPGTAVRLGIAAAGGAAAGFFIACPACWFQWETWRSSVGILANSSNSDYLFFWRHELVPGIGWYGRPYLYQLFVGLPFVLGWPLYVVATLGAIRAVRHPGKPERLLLVLLAVYLLPMGTSMVDAPRYLQPMVPALVLLAARFLAVSLGARARTFVVAGVAAYCVVFALGRLSTLNYLQQAELAQWLRVTLDAGNEGERPRVGLPDGVHPYFRLTLPLRNAGLEAVPLPPEEWLTTDVDAFVFPDAYKHNLIWSSRGNVGMAALDGLESGEAGHRLVAHWETTYWAQKHYTVLDPGLAHGLVPGALGFRIYMRDSTPANKQEGERPSVPRG